MSSPRPLLARALVLGAVASAALVPGEAMATTWTNQPHVPCGFHMHLAGFGNGQLGTVTVSRTSPTGSGVLAQRRTLLHDGALIAFTASSLGLSGQAPSAQGWHLKVTVRRDGKQGGPSKTLWLKCPSTATVTAKATAGRRVVALAAPRTHHPAPKAAAKAAHQVAPVANRPRMDPKPTADGRNWAGGEVSPREVAHDRGWLELKLLVSVLVATLIAGWMVAWAGVSRPPARELAP